MATTPEKPLEEFTASFLLSEFRKDNRELREEMQRANRELREEMQRANQEVRTDVRRLEDEMKSNFKWIVGIQFGTLVAVLGTILTMILVR